MGLAPFVVNELTEAVNPIKLREYLSAGLPVVSTPLPEIYGDDSRVRVAEAADAFAAAVTDILSSLAGPEQRAEAARSMAPESWVGGTGREAILYRPPRLPALSSSRPHRSSRRVPGRAAG